MKLTLPPPNGDITFTLTYKKVKNLNLRVSPDGQINVSAPRQVSRAYIESFVAKNAPRLRTMLENRKTPTELKDGMQFTLFGKPYLLKIEKGASSAPGVIAIETASREEFAKQVKQIALPEIMAMCADLQPLFAKHCPTLPTVKLRQMKTQWANCNVSDNAVDNVSGTRTNTLTFSYNLAFAPMAAIEYVVVHEFCHFVHQDHSSAFYAQVAKILPDWKARRELLKNTTFLLN